MEFLNPTMAFQIGDIGNIPISFPDSSEQKIRIDELVKNSISISRTDWDSFELSWDFSQHPLLIQKGENKTIESAFATWSEFAEKQFNQLKANEDELNRIFIEIYGLQDELSPEVDEKDVTVRKVDQVRDIKSFISYSVGCMFGRYSIDEEGLIFAGGEFDTSRYKTFPADQDNVLPVVSDTYFEDDIVSRFIEFVEVTFSKETLDENLKFIAETLSKKAGETDKETIRRYFLNDFYKDHVQTYKKRPIYWMITSGKSKAFNALIYMHRYDKTTLSRVRTDYLHVLQTRLNAQREKLLSIINGNESEKEKAKQKRA